jgi:hypothetical protein
VSRRRKPLLRNLRLRGYGNLVKRLTEACPKERSTPATHSRQDTGCATSQTTERRIEWALSQNSRHATFYRLQTAIWLNHAIENVKLLYLFIYVYMVEGLASRPIDSLLISVGWSKELQRHRSRCRIVPFIVHGLDDVRRHLTN